MAKRRLISIGHSYAVALNRRLVHELSRAGGEEWEVTAVAPDYFHGRRDLRPIAFQSVQNEPVRVEVVRARLTRFVHFFRYGPKLAELLSQPWDLVHAWEEPFILAGDQIARAANKDSALVFATFQNLDKRYPPPFNWIERRSMIRASAWIAFGQTVAEALKGRPVYRRKPWRIIPPGVDLDMFSPDATARQQCRRELAWDDSEAPVIGFLGRLTEQKGLRLAMRAIESIQTPWRALFVGAGPLEKELRGWAARFGSRVRICSQVSHDHVPRYLNAMDVLIAPSQTTRGWREQFGRMLIEGFACGVPVVGSDSGEIPHVIGDAGVVLPEADADADAWSRELSALLEDPQRRAELSQRGRQRAVDRFSWARIAHEYLEFFDEILEEKRSDSKPAQSHSVPGTRRLLSIGHSYVVPMNRRLVHEMNRAGSGRWEVTAVAPSYFHGARDLRPLKYQPLANEPSRVVVVPTHWSQFVHVFSYGARLKHLLSDGWDFVHAWEEPYIWAGGQIARWTPDDVPIVYRTAQSLNKWYPPPFNWIERQAMQRAAGWICSGTLVAQTLGARQLYASRPMRLIPLGVDTSVFTPDWAAGELILRKLNWDLNGPQVVGYLGRFTEAKGVRLLMNVLPDLKIPWRAMFVGAGPMEHHLRTWAARFGDHVRICTDVHHNDVPAYLNAMDVLAAPSQTTRNWREQFGRMLIEAFATGVPVIGSDSGEIPHVIQSTGVIVPERDQAAWTNALCKLLTDPQKRRELAEAARARAHDEFAWPVIARRYLQFFDELS
jgi:glycosyltransferase involved in cell wall biosynthesis